MARLIRAVLAACSLVAVLSLVEATASASGPDSGQSDALTNYLHKHRLPLVDAQTTVGPDGARRVVLSGYTATAFGKQDAETKTRNFLQDGSLEIENRIRVRPELQNLRPEGQTGSSTGGSSFDDSAAGVANSPSPGSINSYQNQNRPNQYSQQQANQSSDLFGALGSLLGLVGGSTGMGAGGAIGGGSTTFGGAGLGGRTQPYNPYPGYSSPGYAAPGSGAPTYPSQPDPSSGYNGYNNYPATP